MFVPNEKRIIGYLDLGPTTEGSRIMVKVSKENGEEEIL